MYLSNKYTVWYTQIIRRAQLRLTLNEYSERHHIIPRSLGGLDRKSNLVRLTAREHFICHWLLTKMVQGDDLLKMKYAFWRMLVKGANFQQRYQPNSHIYRSLRLQYGSLRKGIQTSKETKEKISIANTGKIPWNKGIPRTSEERKLMSERRKVTAKIVGTWNQGKHHSEDTLKKITERAKNRTKYKCSHCKIEVTGANYTRWHGDNCKSRRL